jgi:flagellar hook-length control protein FliK
VAAKRSAETALPEKAESKTGDSIDSTDTKADADAVDQNQDSDSKENWNNLFGKMTDDGSGKGQMDAKSNSAEQGLKAGLTEAQTKAKNKIWEKISAPKVMKQVETALFKNLKNGTKQLTLQLTPENLGKLNIILQVQGKEVSAMIRAENHDAAKILSNNIDMIKTALENEGLKVEKLEVQAGLTNNQDSQDWFGQNQHNLARDREAMVAMRKHMKIMRGGGDTLAQDLQSIREQAINADNGLHVIA